MTLPSVEQPDLPEDPTALPIFHQRRPARATPSPAGSLAGSLPVAASTEPQPSAADPVASSMNLAPRAQGPDWRLVASLRAQASDRLSAQIAGERLDPDAEQELGRAIIQDLLASHAADMLHDGQQAWTQLEQARLARAVFDAIFRLGRLQPLVDDDTVENVIVAGHDTVFVEHTDGSLEQVEPVADSAEELTDFLAFIAARSDASARSFSSANPTLHMRLDSGDRLAAAAWVTSRPSVVIRRHRLRRVTMDDLVKLNMVSPVMASFLSAAIRRGLSIVVAGPQGGGKTTAVRALANEISPMEAIGTFETEFELMLDQMRDLHPIVHAWEARPGSGEMGPDGRRAGEYTLDDALYDSFRFNLTRQIVGEVRGREVWAMIKAMESGRGSISTTHSADADAAFRKLVTCAMEAGPHVTMQLATSKLSETVKLIVQVQLVTEPQGERRWTRRRWVSEILAVSPGEPPRGYATTPVFRPNPQGGPAIPGTLPHDLQGLSTYGFDLDGYLAQGSLTDGDQR